MYTKNVSMDRLNDKENKRLVQQVNFSYITLTSNPIPNLENL